MIRHRHSMPAAAAALVLAAATPAAAGGCCVMPYSNCPCAPVVDVEPFDAPSGILIVNQGPVYSGPGHALPRQLGDAAPPVYPYVGFVYSGYPYGVQTSGGYPRGFESPFTGYPYVDPPRGYNAPSYVNYRMGQRPGRAYRRAR